MPKKTFCKKKKHQAFCRTQVVEHGLINQADGSWRPAVTGKATDQMLLDGYRAGGKR